MPVVHATIGTNLGGTAGGTGAGSRGAGAWCRVPRTADTRHQPAESDGGDVHSPNKDNGICEVVRIASMLIFHLSE